MNTRQAFNFYSSFDEVMQELSNAQKGTLISAILDVEFLRVHIDDITFKDKILSIVWKGMKHSILKQVDGFFKANKTPYNKDYFAPRADCNPTPKADFQPTPKQEQGEEQEQGQGKEQGEGELVPVEAMDERVNINALNEWLNYKKYKNSQGRTKTINFLIDFDYKAQQDMVNNSIMNNWKGLFPPKQNISKVNNNKYDPSSIYETGLTATQIIEAQILKEKGL